MEANEEYIDNLLTTNIQLSESFLYISKTKPFKGTFSNMSLKIRKRKTENVDYDKTVRYIQSNILPHLDRVVNQVANRSIPLLSKKNPEKKKKWIDAVYKTCRSIILSKDLIGDKYTLTINCATDGFTTITYKGTISDNGDMNFKFDNCVTTYYYMT